MSLSTSNENSTLPNQQSEVASSSGFQPAVGSSWSSGSSISSGSTYASAASEQSAPTISVVPPLFIKVSDVNNDAVTGLEICKSLSRLINPSSIDGVQKVSNLWKVHLKDKKSRVEVCLKKSLAIRGKIVPIHDANPFTSRATRAGAREKADKLTIKNLPMSVSHVELVSMLESHQIELRSDVKFSYFREQDGSLTSFKSGDRFVYVKPFETPIPKAQKVGIHSCIVVHHGKEHTCHSCGMTGHKVGDDICMTKSNTKITTFRGYQHPLSNSYNCYLHVYESTFLSVDHAYLWRMAKEFGQHELAGAIHAAPHAGIARQLAKDIADEVTLYEWECNNFDVMVELLAIKADQCAAFRQYLDDNQGQIIAEASMNKIWGTGMSPYVSAHTAPDYWPGKNMLGLMLMELTNVMAETGKFMQDKQGNKQSGSQNTEATNNKTTVQNTDNKDDDTTTTNAKNTDTNIAGEKAENNANPSTNKGETVTNNQKTQTNDQANQQSKNQQNRGKKDKAKDKTKSSANQSTKPDKTNNSNAKNDQQQRSQTNTKDKSNNKNSKGKKDTSQSALNTPNNQDIRDAFRRKRKVLDSSPTQDNQVTKQVRTESPDRDDEEGSEDQ